MRNFINVIAKVFCWLLVTVVLFMGVDFAMKSYDKVKATKIEETETVYTVSDIYSIVTVVTCIDYKLKEIKVVDFNGEEWCFEELDDNCLDEYCIGSYVTLIMDNQHTPHIYDDTIIAHKYDGWLDGNFGFDPETGKEIISITE